MEGAGDVLIEDGIYYMTSRPRVREKRGYGVEIFRSTDGENYSLLHFISIEEVSEWTKMKILSIENQQLVKDPLTDKYHLYMSLDTGQGWQTFLVTSDDLRGPWNPEGFVIKTDQPYDSGEARDCTISVLDGRYIGLCKARAQNDRLVYTELLLSKDGKNWKKLGIPTIDGQPQKAQPDAYLLNGDIFPSVYGPMFIGTVTTFFRNAHVTRYFGAYIIDLKSNNLEEVFVAEWKKGSIYEREDFPIHTYCNVVPGKEQGEWLIYVEAIDPTYTKEIGVNTEVDRVLLYKSKVIA